MKHMIALSTSRLKTAKICLLGACQTPNIDVFGYVRPALSKMMNNRTQILGAMSLIAALPAEHNAVINLILDLHLRRREAWYVRNEKYEHVCLSNTPRLASPCCSAGYAPTTKTNSR